MEDIRDYLTEKYVKNSKVYDEIKDLVSCAICKDIMIDASYCGKCRHEVQC